MQRENATDGRPTRRMWRSDGKLSNLGTMELLTTADVAKRLRVHVRTVARMAHGGELEAAVKAPGVRGAYLFDPAAVDALAAERGR